MAENGHADLIARLVTLKDDAVANSLQVDQEYAVGPAAHQAGADERASIDRAIDDAIAALSALPCWQPMETAPKDGTRVLLRWAGSDDVQIGAFWPHDNVWSLDDMRSLPEPSGWMPLPDPLK